jgi:GMP synthase-like glutamine amidotransferase
MTRALVVEHIPGENAGALARWLPAAGVELDVCRLHQGDALPAQVEHDALIVMGGPMDAFGDDGDQPVERALIADALARGVPILGICLGAQLLALAAGGQVARHAEGPEYGWGLVRRSDAAADDPLLRTVPFLPDVVHWHSDEITALPPGAVALCRGEHTEVQAFRVATNAWGLQFHIEVDEAMIASWARADGVPLDSVLPLPPDVNLERTWRPAVDGFARVARGLFTGATLSGVPPVG